MRKKKKKLRILILLIIIIAIIIVVVNLVKGDNKETSDNENSVNEETIVADSPKLKEKRKYNNITITNVEVQTTNNEKYILVDIKNENNYKIESENVSITILDEQGNELASVPAIVPALEAGGEIEISASTTRDLSKAYDYRIEE